MAGFSAEDLVHCLFRDCAIYFPLSRDFRIDDFTALLKVLGTKASVEVSAEQETRYWEALSQRMAGKSRWDQIAPRVTMKDDDLDSQRAYGLSRQIVKNVLTRRPYVGFTINSITYAIEVFNPRDELGLGYLGAGDPVVVLLLGEGTFGTVQNQLIKNEQFYSILRQFTEILNPKTAVGLNPATLATLMRAYQEKRASSSVNPWSFFFALSVMQLPKPVGDVSLKRYFKRFEQWDQGRVLLQVNDGLDATLSTRGADAAKLLGMKYVLELHPDWV